MKITIVEGSVEEVIDFLHDAGIVITPEPVTQPIALVPDPS